MFVLIAGVNVHNEYMLIASLGSLVTLGAQSSL